MEQKHVRGFIEGLELCEKHPVMRIYICYKSESKVLQQRQKQIEWIYHLQNYITNPYLQKQIIDLCYPNKYVRYGYEYVSKLCRIYKEPKTLKNKKRLPPWNFQGVYTPIQTQEHDLRIGCSELQKQRKVRFLVKNAVAQRSIHQIFVT